MAKNNKSNSKRASSVYTCPHCGLRYNVDKNIYSYEDWLADHLYDCEAWEKTQAVSNENFGFTETVSVAAPIAPEPEPVVAPEPVVVAAPVVAAPAKPKPVFKCEWPGCDFVAKNRIGLLSHTKKHERKPDVSAGGVGDLRKLLAGFVSDAVKTVSDMAEQQKREAAYFSELTDLEDQIAGLDEAIKSLEALQDDLVADKINMFKQIKLSATVKLAELKASKDYIRGQRFAQKVALREKIGILQSDVAVANAAARNEVESSAHEWHDSECKRFTDMLYGRLRVPHTEYERKTDNTFVLDEKGKRVVKNHTPIPFIKDAVWSYYATRKAWMREGLIQQGAPSVDYQEELMDEVFNAMMWRYSFSQEKEFSQKIAIGTIQPDGSVDTKKERYSIMMSLPFESWKEQVVSAVKSVMKMQNSPRMKAASKEGKQDEALMMLGFAQVDYEELDMDLVQWEGKKEKALKGQNNNIRFGKLRISVRDDRLAEEVQAKSR